MPIYNDVALVLEGGGMRTAVSAGLVTALMEAGVQFPYVTAVSAGATLASSVLSDEPDRLKRSLVDLAAEPEFGGVRYFLRGKGYFNARYIYEHTSMPGQALPFNYEQFLANRADFAIGAFRRDDGGMTWWHRKDVHSVRDMARYVRASSSLPLLMPPTWIGGVCYMDGGLGESIPLSPAVDAGYRRFLIVRSQPRNYRKTLSTQQQLMRPALRRYPYLMQALLTRPARYNAQVATIDELEATGFAYVMAPREMPISRGELDHDALLNAYYLGLRQGREERDRWLAFLEGDGPRRRKERR